MDKYFKLKENGTKTSTEIIAGLTTFFAMSYIIFVNPAMLSQTGIPAGAVFLATIISFCNRHSVYGSVCECAIRTGSGHGS